MIRPLSISVVMLMSAIMIAVPSAQPTSQNSHTAPAPPVVTEAIVENDPELNQLLDNSTLATKSPDEFNWNVLTLIARAVSSEMQRHTPRGLSNDAIWELWPDNKTTFNGKPSSPPVWPTPNAARSNAPHYHFQINPLMAVQDKLIMELPTETPCFPDNSFRVATTDPLQEVRRNGASFGFIRDKNLYHRGGLIDAFQQSGTNPIIFPQHSVEIKAQWNLIKPGTPFDGKSYHWNVDSCGRVYRLVALHIMTRARLNWTWATFEWDQNAHPGSGNPCVDSFGVQNNSGIPAGQGVPCPILPVSAALKTLFANHGVAEEWTHYRLIGSQINCGEPKYLANSIIEGDNGQHSSCMSCHFLARTNSVGTAAFPDAASSIAGDYASCPAPDAQTKGASISFVWSALLHAAAAPSDWHAQPLHPTLAPRSAASSTSKP